MITDAQMQKAIDCSPLDNEGYIQNKDILDYCVKHYQITRERAAVALRNFLVFGLVEGI